MQFLHKPFSLLCAHAFIAFLDLFISEHLNKLICHCLHLLFYSINKQNCNFTGVHLYYLSIILVVLFMNSTKHLSDDYYVASIVNMNFEM